MTVFLNKENRERVYVFSHTKISKRLCIAGKSWNILQSEYSLRITLKDLRVCTKSKYLQDSSMRAKRSARFLQDLPIRSIRSRKYPKSNEDKNKNKIYNIRNI